MITRIFVGLLGLMFMAALGGCALFDKAAAPAFDVLATGIDKACADGLSPLAIEARKQAVAAINERTTVGNHTASDCDSDGLPDFDVDADGMPVMASGAAAGAGPPAEGVP